MAEAQHIIQEQFAEVRKKYKSLKLEMGENSNFFVRGDLHFIASYNGEDIEDNFKIEISIPAEFPREPPEVKETSGRIPPDFHRFNDSKLCLGAPLEVRMKFKKNPTLLGFIEEQIIAYLYSFSFFEKYNKMPYGELAHGGEGIVQYYQQLLSLSSEIAVLGCLRILADDNYRGHHICPCGSSKKIRNCHGQKLREISVYQEPKDFEYDYLMVKKHLKDIGIETPKHYNSKSLMKRLSKSINVKV